MLKIYGVTRSRAFRAIWLCEEIGLPFEQVPVIQRYKLDDAAAATRLHTRSRDFLAVNPNGHIPTIDDDGLILHESLAINLHLARKYGGPLGPGDGTEEALMTMWALWVATEVEGHGLAYFLDKDRAGALAALRAPLAVLDAALAATGHLVGGRFTVADLNTAEVVRYVADAEGFLAETPAVAAWLKACHARPAFQAMWARREAEPLV